MAIKSAAEILAEIDATEAEIKAYAARRRGDRPVRSTRGDASTRKEREDRERGIGTLTPQQTMILSLLANGTSHRAVADHLGIGPNTTYDAVRRAKVRLGLNLRTKSPEVVRVARERGLLFEVPALAGAGRPARVEDAA